MDRPDLVVFASLDVDQLAEDHRRLTEHGAVTKRRLEEAQGRTEHFQDIADEEERRHIPRSSWSPSTRA